jgi:hypothetical protein
MAITAWDYRRVVLEASHTRRMRDFGAVSSNLDQSFPGYYCFFNGAALECRLTHRREKKRRCARPEQCIVNPSSLMMPLCSRATSHQFQLSQLCTLLRGLVLSLPSCNSFQRHISSKATTFQRLNYDAGCSSQPFL